MSDSIIQVIALLGAILGVAYRTYYPYADKVKEMETQDQSVLKWLHKYTFTAVISMVSSVVIALGVYSNISVAQNSTVTGAFIQTFLAAIGTNELLNRVSYKVTNRNIDKQASTSDTSVESVK